MAKYATSKDVYRRVREVFRPFAEASAFKRVKGSEAGWVKRLAKGPELEIGFGLNAWGRSDHGGHLHMQMSLRGDPPTLVRFDLLLDAAGRERKAAVERKVEARWPFKGEAIQARTVQFRSHLFGEQTVEVSRGFTRSDHSFSYYSLEDVTDWMEFIVGELPRMVEVIESRRQEPTRPQ